MKIKVILSGSRDGDSYGCHHQNVFLLTEPFSRIVRIAVMQMAKQAVMQAGDNQSHNSSLGEPLGSSEGDGRGVARLVMAHVLAQRVIVVIAKMFKAFSL